MNFWINFWSLFFYASLVLFAGLAIVVSIGGFFNIRSMFKSMSEQGASEENVTGSNTCNRSQNFLKK